MTEHSKLRLKSSCITRFILESRFFINFAWQPVNSNIQHKLLLYAHFSQCMCNTVNKQKNLTKTCQFCVVQKFKSGMPYEGRPYDPGYTTTNFYSKCYVHEIC